MEAELVERVVAALERAAAEIDILDGLGCPACGAPGGAKDNGVAEEIDVLLEDVRRARVLNA